MKDFPNDKSEAQRNLMREEARSLASDLRSTAGQLGNSRAHEGSNDVSTLQLWAAKAALIGYGKSSPHLVQYEYGLRYYTRLPQYQDWAEDYAIFKENSESLQASEFINPSRGRMDEKCN